MPWEVPFAAAKIAAPALICHVAFLKPISRNEFAAERRNAINELLRVIQLKWGAEPTALDRNNRFSVVNMSWRSLPVTIVFFLSREMVSLRICIHAGGSEAPAENPVVDPEKTVSSAICCLRDFEAMIEEKSHRADTACIQESICELLWKKFFDENPEIPAPDPNWGGFAGPLENSIILADSRGIVLPKPDGLDALQVVEKFEPFITCRSAAGIEQFSISTMRRARVIHISSISAPVKGPPFYVLICDCSFTDADIGELIDIGNRLLIYRLAAIAFKREVETAWRITQIKNRELNELMRKIICGKLASDYVSAEFDKLDAAYKKGVEDPFPEGIDSRLRNIDGYIHEFNELSEWLGIESLSHYRNYKEWADKELNSVQFVTKSVRDECERFNHGMVALRNSSYIIESKKDQADIKHLQIVGEMLVCLLFVPYYFGHAVMETYHALSQVAVDSHAQYDPLVWALAWMLGFSLAVWRFVKNRS